MIYGYEYKDNRKPLRLPSRRRGFTVEFGLLETAQGRRLYGGGILSSPGETLYAMESETPLRYPMNVLDALRTPYRIDIMQPVYYALESVEQLFEIADMDIMQQVHQAMELGLYQPRFKPKNAA